jgi:hypothetical protein
MRGVLPLAVELWTFGSPGRLPTSNFSKCWASPPHLAKVGLRQPVWLPALLLPITWAADAQMTNARPFSISTFQDLFNDTKNTPMQGFLGLFVELWTFGSLGGLQILNFASVGLHPHTWPKWGCDMPHIVGKSQRKLKLRFRLHLNRRSAHKIMGPQSFMNPNFGNFGTKWHLSTSPMAKHGVYYKGEGGCFPQVWVVVSFVSSCLPVARSCTENAPTIH